MNCIRTICSVALAFALVALAPAVAGATATISAKDIDLSGAGDCRSERGSVNMQAVVFLPGETATVNDGALRLRVEFSLDRVTIEDLGRPDQGRYLLNATLVTGARTDVRLRFARVSDAVMLYWRETAEHSGQYAQGLLGIHARQLAAVCRGTGGIWRSPH